MMAENFVPEHLLKEELRFEILVRGADPATDVSSMRSQLRSLFKDQAEVEWRDSLNLEKELAVCKAKVDEWGELAELFRDEPPVGPALVRAESRLFHWLRRLNIVGSAEGMVAADHAWVVEAKGRVQSFLDLLVRGKAPVVAPPPPAPPGDALAGGSASENGLAVPAVATVPSSVSVPTPPLAVSQTPPVFATTSTPLTCSTFNKLPNPLAPLLQSLPVVDGLDVNALLSFLGILFRMREFPGMRENDLLGLLLPYCRSPLADRLTAALLAGYNVDKFHFDVLDFFVPGSMRERLKMELVYRPQGVRESLPEFVSAVKQAVRVLQLGLGETATVGIILDGINPEERSRLVFAGRPSTFLELDRLCVTARSVQFLDQQRGQASASLSSGPVLAVQEKPQNSGRTFVPTCYGCGQRGHIRRFCRRNNTGKDSGPKNEGQGGPSPR